MLSCCCSCGNLVSHDKVDGVYRVPHILNGYRSSKLSFKQCLHSVLVLHNDVGNFWTHFIPLVVWLGWLFALSMTTVDFTDPYWHPLLVLWLGACGYALFSCLAHVFQCLSLQASRVFFMMDYNAIIMYGLAECYAFSQYESPIGSKVTLAHHLLYALLGLGSSVLCCFACFYDTDWRQTCNTVCSVIVHGISIIPILNRLWVCASQGDQCIPETLPLHIINLVIPFFCVFFYVSKFPERCAPGYFDLCFHSHQLFHVSCAIHTSVEMLFLPIDGHLRKEVMTVSDDNIIPGLCNSLLCYILTMLSGLLFILALHLKGNHTSSSPSSIHDNTTISKNINVKQD